MLWFALMAATPRDNVTIRFASAELALLDWLVRAFDAEGFDLGRAGVLRLLIKQEAARRGKGLKVPKTRGPSAPQAFPPNTARGPRVGVERP
jgi:hypothetical protein